MTDPASFRPLFRNPHIATIAGNFWPRTLDERRYPVDWRLYRTEPGVQVLVHTQRPPGKPAGEVVLVHGLEGSSNSGYMRSMAQALLNLGYMTHRTNIRSCGGTEFLCNTLYHSGLTADLFALIMDLDRQRRTPVYLVGFSLGGNQALKLAGEMGPSARRLLAGVAAVSTPLDLLLCARKLERGFNRVYTWRFLRSMKRRLRERTKVLQFEVPWGRLERARTLFDFDDMITGPAFGFTGAEHYYNTQSAKNFLASIQVPTLIVHAQDDPMVDLAAYSHAALRENPAIETILTTHGGHVGFLSRGWPRAWVDGVVSQWIAKVRNK
jgi:hypothetical protein